MSFVELNVKPELVRALKEMGIVEPTEIQKLAIPSILQGRDVIGISKTGSGKTATFGVPLLDKIVPKGGIQVLIIAPVRELAVQIAEEMRKFSKYLSIHTTPVFGGVAIGPQIQNMDRSEIVVGTPGRLVDHLQRGTLDLSQLKAVVLDEADKMVEMGFIEDIRVLLDRTPPERQILLFGATLYGEIEDVKKRYMHSPIEAKAEMQVSEDFLKQYYYNVKQFEKFSLLVHLLKKETFERAIIFCSARNTVELVTKNLRAQGIKAVMIHGKVTQNKRLRTIEDFHAGKMQILVASAVAARGLDIKDVNLIVNYDLSPDPQEYVHRVGRTARAGDSGKAITLLCERDYDTFGEILSRNHRLKVDELPHEDFVKIRFETKLESPSRFGERGSFRSGGRKFGGERRGYGHERSNADRSRASQPRSRQLYR